MAKKNIIILILFLSFLSCDNSDDVIIEPIFIENLKVSKWPYNYESALSFIWDDNNKDHYLKIAPVFDLFNFKASFGLITYPLTKKTTNSNNTIYGYKNIVSNGHEIMSHSHVHLPVEKLNNDQILFELSESKRLIKEIFDVNSISYVHPNNRTNDFYNTQLSLNYLYSRIYNPTFGNENFIANISQGTDYDRFLYIHSLNIETSNWIVIAGHGVDNYGWAPILSEDLNNFLLYLHNHEKTWVDTFSRIALYNDIRDKVKLNYKNNTIIISGVDLNKYKEYFNECILTFNFASLTEDVQIDFSDNPNLLNSYFENNSYSVTIDLFKGTEINIK